MYHISETTGYYPQMFYTFLFLYAGNRSPCANLSILIGEAFDRVGSELYETYWNTNMYSVLIKYILHPG